jgi:hypothetical protein
MNAASLIPMKLSSAILILITLASLASTGFMYFSHHTAAPNSTATAAPTATVTAAATDQNAQIQALQAELKQAKDMIKLFKEKQQSPAAQQPLSATQQPSSSSSKGTDVKNLLGKMMADPSMREVTIQRQISELENQYAGVIQHLQLTPEEKVHFKQLLSARIRSKTTEALKLMEPGLSTEQQKKIVQSMQAAEKQSDSDLQQFMNNEDDFRTFQHWEQTQPERQMMQLGRMSFESAGAPLSADQESQLIDLMAGQRINGSGDVPDIRNTGAMIGVNVNDAFISKLMQKNQRDNDTIYNNAQSFLSPEQLSALKQMLAQQTKLMESSIQMSRQMIK